MQAFFGIRNAKLRHLLGAAFAASTLIGSGSVSASPIITGFQLLDVAAGTLDSATVDNVHNTIDIAKTFTAVAPMTIRLTVAHGTGSGGPFAVTETIGDMTGVAWSDYHISIENAPNGIVFGDFSNSTLAGFTLDAAPASGPRALNFTGMLAANSATAAKFMLSLDDPGKGKTYTLDITQTPSPVPVPVAGYLFGSGLLSLIGVLRHKTGLA